MASTINASNSGFGGIVSTGDSSGQLQLQTANTTAVTIDTSQNVGIGSTSITREFANYNQLNINGVNGSTIQLQNGGTQRANIVADVNNLYIGATNVSYGMVFGVGGGSGTGTERMRIDSSGNLGLNNSNPAQYDTSGKVLNVSGTAVNTNPAVLLLSGYGGGAGYSNTEVFGIAGITAATEITRNTGTGANGFRAYIKITVTGHTGGVGNGINIKEYYWDGGTGAPVQISTYTNGSVPVISFDNTTSNVWIVKLASSNGTSSFNGVMQVEWLMPIDFSSATWTIS